MGNNVACYHDCNAALLYGYGNDNQVKREKLSQRRQACIERLGPESLAKIESNREFVETYEGKELFDEDLIEVKYTEKKGYHVVAKKDIPKGTLVMEEKTEFYRKKGSSWLFENFLYKINLWKVRLITTSHLAGTVCVVW